MKKYISPKIEFVKVEDETSVAMVTTKAAKSLAEALASSASACFPDSLSSFISDWDTLDDPTKDSLLAEDNSGVDFIGS